MCWLKNAEEDYKVLENKLEGDILNREPKISRTKHQYKA